MPSSEKQNRCDAGIKALVAGMHCHCDGSKRAILLSGSQINIFLGEEKVRSDKNYKVCATLNKRIQSFVQNSSPEEPTEEKCTRISSHEEPVEEQCTRMGHKEKFQDDILNACSFYKPYSDLVHRERQRWVNYLVVQTMAVVIDKKKLQNEGGDYLDRNLDLAIDVLTILDAVKEQLQRELKINFHKIAHHVTPAPQQIESLWKMLHDSDDDKKFNTAIALLGEATQRGYHHVRTKIIEEFNVPESLLPSYHVLTKNRPKVDDASFLPDHQTFSLVDRNIFSPNISVDEVVFDQNLVQGKQNSDLQADLAEAMPVKKIPAAKLSGTYRDYIDFMLEKINKKQELREGNIMVIDSFDGAEHNVNSKK